MLAGAWAKDKLYYIERYCHIFNTGMKERWSTGSYIDLFAEPGKCVVEETGEEFDGSPLVSLTCSPPSRTTSSTK
ncbi:MAG: hypothetical protein ACOC58_03835 [Chloroflexota bacterium]